ncbi:MAG: response regulator transcription factor [Anaerolineales bacterium]|nr:response regulator transcription factor [Anaerolineales bacterium]
MTTIFLAEGENHVRDALRLMIENQADLMTVGDAATAESLLAQVCQRPPDLILLDWNLPGLHPQRLMRTLRKYCVGTKVVATSVKPEKEKAAKEWGVDGFLLKQVPPEVFIEMLMIIIGKQHKIATNRIT